MFGLVKCAFTLQLHQMAKQETIYPLTLKGLLQQFVHYFELIILIINPLLSAKYLISSALLQTNFHRHLTIIKTPKLFIIAELIIK